MDLPKRKPNRLKEYNYSWPGTYFITVCTKKHKCILSRIVGASIVGASIARPPTVLLSAYGKIVDEAIRSIPLHYPTITIEHYVVMPNHIHLLLQINADEYGRPMVAPTISTVIQQMKGYVTKKIGFSIWQKLFHDHIIRGEKDYVKIRDYIENNPARWPDDCFYTP